MQTDLVKLQKRVPTNKIVFRLQSMRDFYLSSSILVISDIKQGNLRMVNIMLVILVLIAALFSWPAGWFIIHKWQQNFVYHEGPGWLIFLYSGILALLVAQITVFVHVLKTSGSNPVNSLRYE